MVSRTAARLGPGKVELVRQDGRVVEVRFGASQGARLDPKLARTLALVLATGRIPASLRYRLPGGSGFKARVLRACVAIPWGEVRTYGELARAAGRPGAAWAVGQVMAGNRLPVLVPCHRVVRAGGLLGGFGGGLRMKEFLLGSEGWRFAGRGRRRRLAGRRGSGG